MTLWDQKAVDTYHAWYIEAVAHAISYRGVPLVKWVGDLWNYQMVIHRLKPSLVIEFGSFAGGSALWFGDVLAIANPAGLVVSVDIELVPAGLPHWHPQVLLERSDSLAPDIPQKLVNYRASVPDGPAFAILDSAHHKAHVLAEMEMLRDILHSGDYLVVEDGDINGHPVLEGWGEGPYEAIAEYERRYPNDYRHDYETERRFGWTCAPNGYLVRR